MGSLKNPITSVQKSGSHIEKPAPQIVQIPKEKDTPAARLGLKEWQSTLVEKGQEESGLGLLFLAQLPKASSDTGPRVEPVNMQTQQPLVRKGLLQS